MTEVRVVERFPAAGLALVECSPRPGGPTRIRVHLVAAGTPLAIDPDYGDDAPLVDGRGDVLLGRTPLHAASLVLDHPATGAMLRVAAPLPDDLARAIAWARHAE